MKRNILSLMTIMSLSGLAYAGGDILPIEVEEVPSVIVDESAFYIGLGVGSASVNNDQLNEEISSTMVTLLAGYEYNKYIALEGRVAFGFNSDYAPGDTRNILDNYDDDISSWGVYVKPMYPVTDAFDIYALLGYGGVQLKDLEGGDAYETGFQWGLGVSYAVTDSISVFADYVRLYDDTGFDYRAQVQDIDADTWTLGVTYSF